MHAALFEVCLATSDPERLTGFYRQAFGYTFTRDDDGWMGVAQDRRLRIRTGQPNTLAYAAFAVATQADLDGIISRLENFKVPYQQREVVGFSGAVVHFLDPDGNELRFGRAATAGTVAAEDAALLPARLQHVVFASTNAQRMLDFYLQVLGFTLSDRVVDDAGGLRTAFLRCSHEHHSLAVFAADRCRMDHHCFEATNWNSIRDWSDNFARLRVPLKWGPGRHGPGDNLFIFIYDPDGNWVEISAELEVVAPGRPVGEWKHEERTLNSWGTAFLRS